MAITDSFAIANKAGEQERGEAQQAGHAARDVRACAALGLGTFVAALLAVVPPPFFPQMARDLQVGIPLLGQVMTVMLLGSALFGLIAGPLSDRSGFRRLIISGLAAAVVGLLAFGLAASYPMLFLASISGAIAAAAVIGPAYALASTAFTGAAARKAVGWSSGAQAGAAIIGVPTLTAIGAIAGWRVAFLFAAAVVVAIALASARWLPRDSQTAPGASHLSAIFAPYAPLLRNGTMRGLYAATTCGAICWFGFVTYFGAFLAQAQGMSVGQIGIAYMVSGTGFLLGSLALSTPLSRNPMRRLVVAGYIFMAISIALIFSSRFGPLGSPVIGLCAGVAMGLQVVSMISLLSRETPIGPGTTLTFNTALHKIGSAGGGAIGGIILALSGYHALAFGLPLFGLAAALLGWRAAGSSRSKG
ncbi:MAG: MFS transporter [Thermomicrobiales bacterium]